jgi:PAS domain S-box-containing protein
MAQRTSINWLLKAAGRPSTWLLIALFLLITFFQYAGQLGHLPFLINLTSNLGLTRFTVERILYLLPIVWAGFLFGWKGGAIVSLAAVACMLPRAILSSPVPEDALVETSAVFIIGNLVSYSVESLRKERERRAQLEAAQKELQVHLQVIEADEKRLAALNKTSSIISQSLELTQVLESAADCVADVMGVEAVRIYVLDKEGSQLVLATYRGLSEEFVRDVSRIKMGEGFNGRVAQTGKLLFMEDASENERVARSVVIKENLRSQLIVPLISKGVVIGTLCVAMHSPRSFLPEEIDLLTAIGNQIGVAVVNAQAAEQLRTSEHRYRELFENAHDAIWFHDLEGNIITANQACVTLTGYSLEEMCRLKVVSLLSAESLDTIIGIQRRLLGGHAPGHLDEVKLVKKDGTEAIVQLAGSLVYKNGQPTGFPPGGYQGAGRRKKAYRQGASR